MIKKERLTALLDELRQEKKITVSEITSNIISERSYRRYINEHQSLPFNVFVSLVENLNYTMSDFLMYALNKTSTDFKEEIYLEHYIQQGHLDEAEKLYDAMNHDDYQTYIGSLYLPVLVKKYAYLKGKLSKASYLAYAKSRIDMDQLFKQSVIRRQELDVLLLLLEDGHIDTQKRIIPLVYDVITEKRQLISLKPSSDLSRAIQVLTKTLFSNDTLNKTYEDLLKPLLNLSLKTLISNHLEPSYEDFLKHAIIYYKQLNENKSLERYIFYYVTFILSSGDLNLKLKDPFTINLLQSYPVDHIINDGLEKGYALVNEVIL